jgi:uncharacterized protein YndB with AHSA1/START domain
MATESKESTLRVLSDTQIEMSRVFNAPRELVWKALTDPEAIPQWWGPRYLTTVVDKMDVRIGGAWRYIQKDSDGNVYAFSGMYNELVPPERIVYTFEFEMMAGHVVIDSVTLEDLGAATRMSVMSTFQSKEDMDGMMQSGMEAGANESWDRLAELLAAMQETER